MNLLGEYAVYHRDRRNLLCHEIGIPLIVLAIAALLRLAHVGPLDLAAIAMVATALFYLRLDAVAALLAALGFAGIWFLAGAIAWWAALAFFALGWTFQFVGHAYEGQRPAFTTNLVHLLVGPLFIVAHAARRA